MILPILFAMVMQVILNAARPGLKLNDSVTLSAHTLDGDRQQLVNTHKLYYLTLRWKASIQVSWTTNNNNKINSVYEQK